MKTKSTTAGQYVHEASILVRQALIKISVLSGSNIFGQICVLSGLAMLISSVALMGYWIFVFTISMFSPTGIGHLLGLFSAAGAVILFSWMLIWGFAPLTK
ncbi:MAG: hypothetical protein C0508_23755 [Cyanobacteria bacterium PR.023]|nr:hypothetical protein [Cyanobacteria bacterium PR.023]